MNKVKQAHIHLVFYTAILFLFTACGSVSETAGSITLEAVGSGPFFSGPNSLIAEYEVDLAAIEGLENVQKEQIESVKIKSIQVILNEDDDMDFSAFSSASMQMVSAAADMQTIGIKNPIDSKNLELTLQASEEVDIAEYFKGDKLSLVLDLDFTEDSYSEQLGAKVVMEVNVTHK